ncbi:MAG: flagellar basal body-associated FliL family protein [Actinomycetia bacterium]|nr:flagellar basal body-associated FliL family protein [Actinomycetes bacterium]MCP4223856.1 flagellar basal body-associated FliL family protein [Actinomycetes bacterium]MCP5035298.1 flagellar basal body-associated FliL family protein [Actinomycetes bacterium]
MADDDIEEAEDEEEGGGGGKKKLILIVLVVVVLGAVYQFVLKSPAPEELDGAMPEAIPAEPDPVEGEIVEMEEMILNIGGDGSGYLRIGLALILEEGTAAGEFESELAIAKDVAIQYLASLSDDQLRSTEGRQQAKDDLSMLIREAYGGEKVVRVLFTALVMQ